MLWWCCRGWWQGRDGMVHACKEPRGKLACREGRDIAHGG